MSKEEEVSPSKSSSSDGTAAAIAVSSPVPTGTSPNSSSSSQYSSVSSANGSSSSSEEEVFSVAEAMRNAALMENVNRCLAQNEKVSAFLSRNFLDRVRPIVNDYLPRFVIKMRRFLRQELGVDVEKRMMAQVEQDLAERFPVPKTREELDAYRDLDRESHKDYVDEAYYLTRGPMPENVIILTASRRLSRKLTRLSDELWRLSTAIHLLAPAEQQSANTGVQVQLTITERVTTLRRNAAKMLLDANWVNYAQGRCRLLSRLHAFPQCDDLRRALVEYDRACLADLRQLVRNLALDALVLQHVADQHMDLIMTPRADHSQAHASRIFT